MKCHRFVESARLFVIGGRGGNGCSSFCREKFVPLGGPDGGHGGNGGSVVVRADHNVDSLVDISYRPHRHAGDGAHGKGKKLRGRNGDDLVLKVPCGTEVWDDSALCLLDDLVKEGAELLVARGGKGGLGNSAWKRGSSRAIDECTPGEPGEQKTLRLELKIVADVGFVGHPNAGKSSLLSVISRASPKIAPFPFTTMRPVLGTIQYDDIGESLTVVDIPALIKNSSRGAGLGNGFLRHIERARFLAFVIDMSGEEGRNPAEDYRVLLDELRLYKSELAERPSLVVANKMDLAEAAANMKEFQSITGRNPLPVSAIDGHGVEEFKLALRDALLKR